MKQLDTILSKYNVIIVGNGYIDCIIEEQYLESIIVELSNINVKVTSYTLWEKTKIGEKSFQGMGGPRIGETDYYYAEMVGEYYDYVDIKTIRDVIKQFDFDVAIGLWLNITRSR